MGAGLILVVCTGNVCRSPYIERLLAAQLAPYGVQVASAGTHALMGEPMDPEVARLLADAGLSGEGFVARQLTPDLARSADLVLTATRDHRRHVVRMAPKALRHTHAIDDFSDLVAGADLQPTGDGSFVAQLAAGAAARRDEVAVRDADGAGIVDPYRRSPEVFGRMAAQVGHLLPPIVRAARHLAATPNGDAAGG
ncbi:MAG TPA: low molecular weight phosphatase family protein [Flexivirga sp.]|uniref:arsenate reductase/protein-tyrosine-phosphatase family protein n=1 Tax=Flexivirga sp. TaxID=1962927 RepID=UPI002BC7A1C7|nr:low molecular weight phosphatase family protein [Flexivirga sp.]HWC21308.1 low molecular weight phosphatase family protein [Flexivirga sp.]